MRQKRKVGLVIGAVMIIIAVGWMMKPDKARNDEILTEVKRDVFEVVVFTTGELEAKNSIDIMGPKGLRMVQIYRVQISDLVEEGTRVKKGDYIASLDKTEISNRISDANSELSTKESKYIQTKLDTTLELREARDQITDLEYKYKESEIVLEQSEYEPPATKRHLQLELEKALRSFEQAKENYKIKEKQAAAKMNEAAVSLNLATNKLDRLEGVLEEFTVTAPEDGMVVYKRDWDGKKITANSEISAWSNTVATLPDLSVMISKTYVNEVDIRKVKVDQQANITLDAFPEKKLTGKVISVANVGEQLPNSDAKVFEVQIEINERDTTLRPAMTTGNNILADKIPDALQIPLESIHNIADSVTFVYKKHGWGYVRQEITIGTTNADHAIVVQGLKEEDQVLLSTPANGKDLELVRLEKLP